MNQKTLFVVSIILLLIGSFGLTFSMTQIEDVREGLHDPENDALKTLEFEGGESKTVDLEEGVYDIWTKERKEVDSLEVTDSQENSVYEQDRSQTITIDRPSSEERAYEKLGGIDINEDGEYIFETDERCTLYVTDDYSFLDFFKSLGSLIILIPVSIVLVITGLVLAIWVRLGNKDCP